MRILEVKDLTVYFRTFAGLSKVVENISFTLEKGESLALVGESGSGKTTVLITIL